MKVGRVCGLIVGLGVIALGLVALRIAQARSASRALQREGEWVAMRRDLWSVQTRVARLKTPGQVRTRAERFGIDLVEPVEEDRRAATGAAVPARRPTRSD